MKAARRLIKKFLRKRGYGVYKIDREMDQRNSYLDMWRLCRSKSPLILDVGANVGQSIELFREYFPNPTIHAFEPSLETFQTLKNRTKGIPDLFLINAGLGAKSETRTFFENSASDMSSFLQPGPDCWGTIVRKNEVTLQTVDSYCKKAGIDRVDILKSDTQGFELEVIKGSEQTLPNTHLIFLEVIFSDQYQGTGRFDHIYGFLVDRGFVLSSFYRMFYQRDILSWTDALFVNRTIAERNGHG